MVITCPAATDWTGSFNFRLSTGFAKAFENSPTPAAGTPGSDLTKLRKISCATSAAIILGSVRKTPDKKGSKTFSYSVGNLLAYSPKSLLLLIRGFTTKLIKFNFSPREPILLESVAGANPTFKF